MANLYIEPVFNNPLSLDYPGDLLTFLGLLRGATITALNVVAYQAWKANRPAQDVGEPNRVYFWRLQRWKDEGIGGNRPFFALWKWDGYKLGKVKPSVEAYLATIGGAPSNRIQARQMVRLQLQAKWSAEIVGLDINVDLIPLIEGIVW